MAEKNQSLDAISKMLDEETLEKVLAALLAVQTTGWGTVTLEFTEDMKLSAYAATPRWINTKAKRLKK